MKERAVEIVKEYIEFENSSSFFDKLSLTKDISRCINFVEGRQWSMSKEIESYPKITLNFIKQMETVKINSILQNNYGYLIDTIDVASIRKLQDFLHHLSTQNRLVQKDIQIARDDFRKGTGILFFYYDAEARNVLAQRKGMLKSEVIDIRYFRVANPYINNIQEQQWVMYVSRERIDAIEYKYGVGDILPETDIYAKENRQEEVVEDVKSSYTNVYTKFFRDENGQVCYKIFTKYKVLQSPRALNPYYNVKKLKEAPSTLSTMDEKIINEIDTPNNVYVKEVFGLYPFVRFCSNERDNCFYGIPQALEHIDTQKSLNQHFAVFDKAVRDAVLGGWLTKRGALGNQDITTDTSQVLEVDLKPNERLNDVISRLPVNNVPQDSISYSTNLLAVAKQVSGVNNVSLGQSDYSGQSGKQTELLLQRATQNSGDYAILFNQYKIDQAYIMFLFAKFFYDQESFAIIEHGFQKDSSRTYLGDDSFNGTDYLGQDVLINIEVGQSQSFSEYNSVDLVGKMVQTGNAPFEAYISMLPESAINNKEELLELARDNTNKVIQQLQEQMKQQQQVMQQMAKTYNETQEKLKNIDIVINENTRLKQLLADQTAKMIENTNKSNQMVSEAKQDTLKALDIISRKNNNK